MRHNQGKRSCPESLYQLWMLGVELARMVHDGRVLTLRVFRHLLNRLRRDLPLLEKFTLPLLLDTVTWRLG